MPDSHDGVGPRDGLDVGAMRNNLTLPRSRTPVVQPAASRPTVLYGPVEKEKMTVDFGVKRL